MSTPGAIPGVIPGVAAGKLVAIQHDGITYRVGDQTRFIRVGWNLLGDRPGTAEPRAADITPEAPAAVASDAAPDGSAEPAPRAAPDSAASSTDAILRRLRERRSQE